MKAYGMGNNIAGLWEIFREGKSTVYIPSRQGYQPMDGYALYYVSRQFPPSAPLKLIPVHGYLQAVEPGNLIIIGRLWVYGCEEIIRDTIGDEIDAHAHVRFLDNIRLLNIETGEMFQRVDQPAFKTDFGVIRLVKKSGKLILHLAGLGAIGTLGAAMSISTPNTPVSKEVNKAVGRFLNSNSTFMEILILSEWYPNDPVIVNPSDIKISEEKNYDDNLEVDWPIITIDKPGKKMMVSNIKINGINAMNLCKNENEFAILNAIAAHTNKYLYRYEESNAYISFEEIARDPEVKKRALNIQYIRVTLGRISGRLMKASWVRNFRNLLLKSNISNKPTKVGFKFRAKIKWVNE